MHLLSLIWFSGCLPSAAQSSLGVSLVVESDTLSPLVGATVVIRDGGTTEQTCRTDAQGRILGVQLRGATARVSIGECETEAGRSVGQLIDLDVAELGTTSTDDPINALIHLVQPFSSRVRLRPGAETYAEPWHDCWVIDPGSVVPDATTVLVALLPSSREVRRFLRFHEIDVTALNCAFALLIDSAAERIVVDESIVGISRECTGSTRNGLECAVWKLAHRELARDPDLRVSTVVLERTDLVQIGLSGSLTRGTTLLMFGSNLPTGLAQSTLPSAHGERQVAVANWPSSILAAVPKPPPDWEPKPLPVDSWFADGSDVREHKDDSKVEVSSAMIGPPVRGSGGETRSVRVRELYEGTILPKCRFVGASSSPVHALSWEQTMSATSQVRIPAAKERDSVVGATLARHRAVRVQTWEVQSPLLRDAPDGAHGHSTRIVRTLLIEGFGPSTGKFEIPLKDWP